MSIKIFSYILSFYSFSWEMWYPNIIFFISKRLRSWDPYLIVSINLINHSKNMRSDQFIITINRYNNIFFITVLMNIMKMIPSTALIFLISFKNKFIFKFVLNNIIFDKCKCFISWCIIYIDDFIFFIVLYKYGS